MAPPLMAHLGLENCIAGMAKFGPPLLFTLWQPLFIFCSKNFFVFNFFQEKNWEIFGKTFSSVNLTEFFNVWKKLSI
jgi:hypothetical protein